MLRVYVLGIICFVMLWIIVFLCSICKILTEFIKEQGWVEEKEDNDNNNLII